MPTVPLRRRNRAYNIDNHSYSWSTPPVLIIVKKAKLSIFDSLGKFSKIIISGPQRSGTRVAAKMAAHDTGHRYVDEVDIGIHDLQQLRALHASETNFVVQCPALCRWVHEFGDEDTAIVMMKRDPDDIAASEERIGWKGNQNELQKYGLTEGSSAEAKYLYWKQQRPQIANAFEVEYEDLKEHPLWIPKDERRDFRAGQTTAIEADIIIPVWNHLDLTKRVIQSVRDNTSVPYRLIVVDDGSTDGTAEWLAEQYGLTVITNETNLGFAPSVNRGLQAATAPYVVLLNNDVEVDGPWLKTLIEGFGARPRIGAIGPQATARQQLQWEGNHLGKQGVWRGIEYLAFFCTIFKREVIEEVGLLDEGFAPCYGEDDDYAIRMRRARWELALHCDVLVKHDHGQTTGPAGLARYHGAAYKRLKEKWGRKVWISILNQGDMRPELTNWCIKMSHSTLHQVHIKYPNAKPIANNRNQIVKQFLESGYDYLLMIDNDITPTRNPLDLVVLDKDILGLPCPSWNPGVNPDDPLYFVVMEYVDEEQAMRPALLRNDAGLTRFTARGRPIDAVGTGAILIARRVLEAVRAPFERFWDGDGIQQMGLDFAFCLKARQLDFEVWTHMDYPCGHHVTLNLLDVNRVLHRR